MKKLRYMKAIASKDVLFSQMIINKTNTQFGPISCFNHKLKEEPVYYEANCSAQFLHQQLNLKADVFIFLIYPNIIGSTLNTHLGVNSSATVYTGNDHISYFLLL